MTRMFCTQCTCKFVYCPVCGNKCDAQGDNDCASTHNEDEYRIVIFGMCRHDIVSTTNALLGEKRLKSVTGVETMTIPCLLESGQRYGKELKIVTTTGFQDETLQDKLEGLKSAVDLLKPGANVFILVTSIDEFSEEERVLVRCLKCLGEMCKYAVVLFTHFDENVDDRVVVREQIKSSENLKELLQFSNSRFELIDKSSKSDTQIKAIFDIINEILQENQCKYFNTSLFTEKSKDEIQKILKEKNDKRNQQIALLKQTF